MNQNDFLLLSELLIQIRGIASDAAGLGHVSSLGRGQFNEKEALKAIYELADAAHNIPAALAGQARFLLNGERKRLVLVGEKYFGEQSTFKGFITP